MGDMLEYDKNVCSSTASLNQTSSPPDEISLFLQQIMVRSSSSSSTSSVLAHTGLSSKVVLSGTTNAVSDNIQLPAVGDGISAVDCSSTYSMANIRTDTPYASFSPIGASETENDDYDCESEGLDALVEDMPAKPMVGSSSKRSRAAEVHNLSEKRRRSRINEKMKALQNLIPNSHKTDKASMLDEAIEYLKQLQLQVQMLSMRNGLSLHPMCLPDGVQPIQLPQMRMDFDVGNSVSNQPMVSNMSNIFNSEISFGLESSIRDHLGPLHLQIDAEEICKEDRLHHQQTIVKHTAINPLEFEAGGMAIMTSDAQASNLKGRDSIEACMRERNQSESGLLKAIEQSLMLPSHLNSIYTERSTTHKDDIKTESYYLQNL